LQNFRKGFDIKAILSPTVPQERLRFVYSYNSPEEISEVLVLLSKFLSIDLFFCIPFKKTVKPLFLLGFKNKFKFFCNVLLVYLLTSSNQIKETMKTKQLQKSRK
jgi:hypothetical protein